MNERGMLMHEEGTFASLLSSVRDVFFPQKLPPLVLESTPIPVPDRMKTRQDPRATAASFVIYALLISIILWMVNKHVQFAAPVKQLIVANLTPPPEMPKVNDRMGGGGGQRGPTPVAKGQLPKFADQQITPPKAPPMEQPKIKMPEPTIEVQKDLKMASNNMPNLGMPNSPLIGSSMGNGSGSGLGSGNGSGLGPGSGGNYGGGLRHVGGGVSSPEVIYKVEPEFSEEARKAKFMGVVTVTLIVNTQGLPQDVHVIRGVGMGLDDKAVEAVRQYKFKPAMENGHPVPVRVNVEVNFQIF
ncbi:MAG TPA: TonB family protein [Acidobacteriaceae bacterium]|nr:TonB family protein [Acidobacteriaceae bacterium]